jgi:hypothetical protein
MESLRIFNNPTVIAIGGFGEEGIEKMTLFKASLPKPFKLITLLELIRSLLNKSKSAKG